MLISNEFFKFSLNSCGIPCPFIDLKIDSKTNEIMIKGRTIF